MENGLDMRRKTSESQKSFEKCEQMHKIPSKNVILGCCTS